MDDIKQKQNQVIAQNPASNRSKPPCKDCQDRYTACSDHCHKPEYLAWRAENDKIRYNRRRYVSPIWKHGEGV